jgi:hypothetical protein
VPSTPKSLLLIAADDERRPAQGSSNAYECPAGLNMLPSQLGQPNNIPVPSSLQSALAMDANQPHLQMQPPPPPQGAGPSAPTAASTGKRRRKGTDTGEDAPPSLPEPRRLRRSHEACARCRSKKIKASAVGVARRQFPYFFPSILMFFVIFSPVRFKAP